MAPTRFTDTLEKVNGPHPGIRRDHPYGVVDDPSLVPSATQEILRRASLPLRPARFWLREKRPPDGGMSRRAVQRSTGARRFGPRPSREDAVRFLQERHFLRAPVLNLGEVLKHPQFKFRRTLQPLDVPGFSQIPLPRAPFHFSESPVEIPNHLALLGQDNEEVLGKYLRYGKERVEELTRRGLLVRDSRLAAQD